MNTLARRLTLAVLLAVATPAFAADPKGPDVDTSFLKLFAETRGFMLGRPVKPKITPDGNAVLFLRAEGPKKAKLRLFEFNTATLQTRERLSPESLLKGADENLSPEEKARRERQRVSVGGFADYHLDLSGRFVLVSLSGRLFVFDRTTDKSRELKTGEGGAIDPQWSPDGARIAYVRGFDVYTYDLASGKESPVTTGGTAIKTHGLAEFVAQEEMSRFSGYWWSPDSKTIIYEEADHTGVETWWIADPLKPDIKPQEQFYPRPGKANVKVRLGIIPATGGKTTWIDWDRTRWEYLAAVRWKDYQETLTIQLQDRKQQTLGLFSVDPKTGKSSQLLLERDNAWVNLEQNQPWFSGAMGGFFWLGADPEGNPEIQLRLGGTGKLTDVMVAAKHHPDSILDVHSSRFDTIINYAANPDPTQQWIYRRKEPSRNVNPGSDKDDILSRGDGVHTATFAPDGWRYTITSTSLKKMPETWAFNRDANRVGDLASIAMEPPFVPQVKVEKVGDYWTAVVRPRGFDATRKYPVIVDVYGGPKHQHVVQAMRNWLIPQWLADQGFIVVAIENRGTSGRGRDWERAVYEKFGTVPIEDQVKGLHALCDKYPEMDRDRVGIVGWSFGGYMAANAVLRKPDIFKAAVAGAPVTDWEDYDTHYTERYMGLLPENRKAYDEGSLLPLAKDLSRPLLLVHGTADDNVYYRHTLKLSKALFLAGREFDVLPLPGVTHMYSADPAVAEKLWARTVGFFKKHLGEPS